jgi:hypothetical protein
MKPGRAARDVKTPAEIALTAAVDRSRRLSEGGLVQASVRARLLGLPLLRLDATIALLPAGFSISSRAGAAGNGLADAVRTLNEGAEILGEARRNGRR